MNLAIRGISANLGDKHADTFASDQHKDLKADYIMAGSISSAIKFTIVLGV
jgi:type I restriction enzyme M protein